MRAVICLAALLGGCTKNESGVTAQKRALTTDLLTFDAGMAAVDTREVLGVYLASVAQGEVRIYDVQVEDEEHWIIGEGWKTDDCDGDGENDCQLVDGGSASSPSYTERLDLTFAPSEVEEYRTMLTIVSDDTEVTERNDEGYGLWRVVLRGIGRVPCAHVSPHFVDFGPRPLGGFFELELGIYNCGVVTLTVADFQLGGDPSFAVDTPAPLTVLATSEDTIDIAFNPGSDGAEAGVLSLLMNDPDYDQDIAFIGNNCPASNDEAWDADGDGWWSCGGDCDDTDPDISPSGLEVSNGRDDDCDGDIDEAQNDPATDDDGDGYSEDEGDCDDASTEIGPEMPDDVDQIDNNCDGRVDEDSEWSDDDGDGMAEREGDCDDADAEVVPGADEFADGIDNDCDGQIDEGTDDFDDDADGYAEIDDDCNDGDPWSFPGATEDCDEIDNDCDGLVDEGEADEENGACFFEVERELAPTEEGGCAAVSAPAGWLLMAGLCGVGWRRRDP